MSRDRDRPLAADIPSHVDEARLARQWSAVSARLERRPRSRLLRFTIVPALVVVATVIAILVSRPWRSAPSAPIATPSATQSQMVLADGSRLEVAPSSHVSIVDASRDRVHLFLDDGSVECDVTHVEGRPFVVTAAGHDVTVLGTMFKVSILRRDGKSTLSVDVRRGRVRVTGPTGEHVLDAGQSWSTTIDPQSTPSASSAASAIEPAPAVEAAPEEVASASASPSVAAPAPAPAPVEGARELLARATDARAKGHPRDAAIALDTLRKKHRSDARAGLAAFELGRLRLDSLGDPAGAVEAFSDAITLSPSAPFREDAEARRVDALDALGDRARCERARDAYLSRYPAGLHAKRIAQRCTRP